MISRKKSSKKKPSTADTSEVSLLTELATQPKDKTAMVSAKLKSIYTKAVLPIEKRYKYDYFFESPFLSDVEFDAKPQVLLIGQYSVGKTSFIRYLLGRDFPGQRIGPEPTTDRFTGKFLFSNTHCNLHKMK